MFCTHELVFGGTEGIGSRLHVLCARTHFSAVPRASGPVFMSFAPELFFGGTEGIRSRFRLLRARTLFWGYRGRRVPFSNFALPESFSAVPRASSLLFMFCTHGLLFGGIDGVGSRFHVMRSRTRFSTVQRASVQFSCYARPDSFSAVPRASGLILMFCAPRLKFSTVPRASGPVFMFCAPGLVFDGTKGVGSRFHILRTRTPFRRCLVRWVPISCFAHPFSFSTVTRALGPVIMFCSHELVFSGTEGVGSRFNVLRVRTCFIWYQGHQVSFSCFARPDTISAVSSASGPYFKFGAPVLVFSCTEGVRSRFHVLLFELVLGGTKRIGSRFHVLRARTHFRRYRGCRVPFSFFPRPQLFSLVPRATGPVYIFCAPALVFCSTKGVWSRYHVLRAPTLFRRYRGRRVPFSCFARPYAFSAVPRAFDHVFMFCAPQTHFRRYQGRRVPFSAVPRASDPVFSAPDSFSAATEGVGSRFRVFCARARFRGYRGRRVPFSCFARPNSFSALWRASGPVFMYCAHRFVFGSTGSVRSCFHVLRALTRFRRCRGRRVPFSCFARPHSFFEVPRASGPIFMFCAPGLVFDGTVSVGYPFSYFARLHSFFAVPRASGPVFMFCAPGLIFDGTEGVGSHFLIFRARTSASDPYFMFCAPVLVFSGTEGVGSRFHVLHSGLVFSGTEVVRSRFHVLLVELIFGGSEGVRSLFHVMRARTRFQQFRWRRIPFSCFASPYSFSAVARAPGRDFMFCAPRLVFGGTKGVGSRFLILRAWTSASDPYFMFCARSRFQRYRGRRVPFSCFALPDSFSTVPRAPGLVFMFCAPGLIFDGTEGVGSLFHVFFFSVLNFGGTEGVGPIFMFCAPRLVFGGAEGVDSRSHVLRYRTHFQRYRGRRLSFSSFALPDSFSTVPMASDPVFIFCVPVLVFRGIEGVGSRFSCFALPDSFSAVPRASGPVFMFCTPGLVFGGYEVFGSCFHVLRARTRCLRYRGRRVPFSCFVRPDSFSAVPRASGPVFMCCIPGLIFGGVECIGSGFMFCADSRFQLYRGRGVPFSGFSRPNSFSAVQRESGSVFMFCATGLVFGGMEEVGSSFMFCAPGLIFGCTEGVGSRFHVLHSQTHFRRCRVHRVRFLVLRSLTHFRRYRVHRVPFSCFARPD
jgi:hypothetical protein